MLKVGDRVQFTEDARNTFHHRCGPENLRGTITALSTAYRSSDSTPLATVRWDTEGSLAVSTSWDSAWLEGIDKVDKFYIIWNPKHPSPPRVQFFKGQYGEEGSGYDDAVRAAEGLARRNPGEEFFICEMKALVQCEISGPKLTKAA